MRRRERNGTFSRTRMGALGGLLALYLASTSSAADIIWSMTDFNTSNLDLSGTIVQAVNFGTTSQTVTIGGNTATFVTSNSITPLNGGFQNGPNDTAALTPTYTNVAGNIALENVLRSHSWTTFGGPGIQTVTLSGLLAGHTYQLQAFMHDGRTTGTPPGGLGNVPYYLTDPSGNPSPTAVRNQGSIIVGTFTADASAQNFNVVSDAWDPALSGYVLRALTGGAVTATLNRSTGNLSIHNGAAMPFDMLGYTVSSGFGGLNPSNWLSVANNYDKPSPPTPGNGSIDPDDAWTILRSDNFELAEAELNVTGPRNGGRILAGQTLNLGNVWIKSPTEDLVVEVLRADGGISSVPITFTGNNGQPFPVGDLDFDGQLTPADWTIFMSHALTNLSGLSPAQQYQRGDFNGDGVNNLNDMQLFFQAYDAGNGAGSAAALLAGSNVPEPSTWILLLLGALLAAWRRVRQWPARPTIAAVALIGALVASSSASAQVVLNPIPTTGYDQDIIVELGATVGTVVTTGELGSRQFYEDGLQASQPTNPKPGLTPIVTSTLSSGSTVNFEFQPFTQNNILKFDASNPGPKALSLLSPAPYGSLAVAFSGGSLSASIADLNYTINFAGGQTQTGTIGVPDWGNVALPAGTEMLFNAGRINMGVPGTWNNQVPEADTTPNRWSIYVSEISISNPTLNIESINFSSALTGSQDVVVFGLAGPDPGIALTFDLQVDKQSGLMSIRNSTPQDIGVRGYEILSTAGSLSTAGWTVPNGWLKAGGASNFALEAGSLTSYPLAAEGGSPPLPLGTAYDTGVGAEDLAFRFLTSAGDIRIGTVSYLDAALPGDHNGDGVVDARDYVLWRKTGVGGQQGYDDWRTNFGRGAGGTAAAAVPEPAASVLLLAALAALFGLRRRVSGTCVFAGSFRRRAAAAALACLTTAGACFADAFPDRIYSFGDDPNEDAANATGDPDGPGPIGGHVGTGPNNIATPILGCCFTLDTFGPVTGSRPPLQAFGNPHYINVSTTGPNLAQPRPGAASGSLGILFDGVDDYLFGGRLNYPHNSLSAQGGGGPLDYNFITNRGFQLWVYPSSAKQGQAQEVVNDSNQHGLWINAAGDWVMRYNNASTTSTKAVAFDEWTHAMVVRPYGHAAPNGGSILYINGEAVAAAPGGYALSGAAVVGELVVGANTGTSPGTLNHFQGVLDDMDMFIIGQVFGGPNPPPGTYNFNLPADNAWMSLPQAVTGLSGVPGDVNQDGLVNAADVAALVAGWGKEKRVNNVRVGDKLTILDGDLNFDGIVNIADVFILHQALLASGSGSGFDFSLLPGWSSVPEPGALGLVACFAVVWSICFPGRRSRD